MRKQHLAVLHALERRELMITEALQKLILNGFGGKKRFKELGAWIQMSSTSSQQHIVYIVMFYVIQYLFIEHNYLSYVLSRVKSYIHG